MRLDKTLLVVEEVEVMVSGVVSGTESVCWHHILHYIHESNGICYLVIQLVSTIHLQFYHGRMGTPVRNNFLSGQPKKLVRVRSTILKNE